MTGIERIAAERKRQIDEEGWTAEHDDKLVLKDLALAAVCYAVPDSYRELLGDKKIWIWPWAKKWWKPTPGNRIRELEKAGALIAAEIDRLQRLEGKNNESTKR
jgi:hypothetical protein